MNEKSSSPRPKLSLSAISGIILSPFSTMARLRSGWGEDARAAWNLFNIPRPAPPPPRARRSRATQRHLRFKHTRAKLSSGELYHFAAGRLADCPKRGLTTNRPSADFRPIAAKESGGDVPAPPLSAHEADQQFGVVTAAFRTLNAVFSGIRGTLGEWSQKSIDAHTGGGHNGFFGVIRRDLDNDDIDSSLGPRSPEFWTDSS